MSPAVKYGRDVLNLDIHEGTLHDIPIPQESFDAVVLIETVEHLLDPLANLKTAFTLLRPGGIIFIAVPNQNSIMRSLLGIDWSVLSPAEHLYYFTEDSMRQILDKAGFTMPRFIWQVSGQSTLQTMNPYHSHRPNSWRSRFIRPGVRIIGPIVKPFVIKYGRTDRLMVIANKPGSS